MTSFAVLAFEAALQRVSPDTPAMSPLSAVDRFDSLIKARKKKAAEAAPAPMPEQPTGQLGRGTGYKDDSFEFNHPHLVHGNEFKLLPVTSGGKTTHVPIGPDHKAYNSEAMLGAQRYTVERNPLEAIARIGYRMKQTMSSADMQHAENPNSRHHAAYLFDQISREMHPMSSRNLAHRQKKAGGMHPQVVLRNITSGMWSADNKDQQGKDNPANLGDSLTRIWDRSHSQGSKHAANLTTSVLRGEMITRGFNRIFHVARKMGKDFHGNMDLDLFHSEVQKHPLTDFSGRREIQGLHPEHLGSKHDPSAAADFDAKGKKTWRANPFYGRKKNTPHPMAEHLGSETADNFDNHVDFANHLVSLPISHGNRERKSGRALISHYLPGEVLTRGTLDTHARMRGVRRPTPQAGE